jgi:Spy/CpxP family protein refolding chaperone
MEMKTRSVVILVATLFLGIILGMLTSAQIRYHKLKPIRVFFSEERFREGIYSVINPDESQMVKLDEIIKKYSRRNREIQTNFRRELDNFTKDLWKEMDPVLTREQVEKLQEMEKKRFDFNRQGRGRPPGDTIWGEDSSRPRMRHPGDSLWVRQPGNTGPSKPYGVH